MSRILLDTYLLLWAFAAPERLPIRARKRIDVSEVFVSAASIWEVSIKASLGKIHADASLLLAEIEPAGFTLLPISGDHAVAVGLLPSIHRDPFDRILVAQCLAEKMTLLTNDTHLQQYPGIKTLW